MARIPSVDYGSRVDTDAAYPQGKAKNIVGDTVGTGTPLEEKWLNDDWGFKQAILKEAGITPSGSSDNADNSQYLDGLKVITDSTVSVNVNHIYEFDNVVDMISSSIKFPTNKKIRTSFYNTNVICDWFMTQSPASGSINVAITGRSGWYAQLVPLLGTILTPEMAGAYGNGINEDHAAIQACLDYFEDSGFHGLVKADREYIIGATIEGRRFASIDGCGLFKAKNALNAAVIDIYAEYPVRKIEDTSYTNFRVDGNKANQTTTDKILGSGFSLRCDVINAGTNGAPDGEGEIRGINIDNITTRNCKVNGFYFGKNTFVEEGYAFSKLKSKDNAVNGVFLDDFCEYITFNQCIIQTNQYGVRDGGSSNISFIGGMSANNTEAGFYLETTGRNTSKKIITGMHINHNKRGVWIAVGQGTVAERHDQITITNNHILANDRQGVIGTGGDRVIVKNNIFSGNGGESAGVYDDIDLANNCREWDINNTHRNSTGDTRSAVHYDNAGAFGIDAHNYHKIDGCFEGYTNPIGFDFSTDPNVSPLNANTNFIQGVFEYWNTAGNPPSSSAGNANASVDTQKIPLGTICINNADNTGAERWRAVALPSSATSGTGYRSLTVGFERVADYVAL